MTTPIVMLLLMAGPAVLARAAAAATGRPAEIRRAAAFGLGLMFVFTGLGHFVETETMALILPASVPARVPMIYATGVLEFAIALGFFVRPTTRLAGWAAAGLLIVILPGERLRRDQQGSHGRPRMGPGLPPGPRAGAACHPALGVLVHHPARVTAGDGRRLPASKAPDALGARLTKAVVRARSGE